ncbi:MAG TPA: DUF445 domain-containing protein [Acidimicrobiales bacterium]|nr:DUF445 domain-containing protein [Acidimicrobiales bacterium]
MAITPSGPTAPDVRVAELRAMKRRATGLLAVVAIAFVAIHLAGDDQSWVPYALAAAEGSMVGGLADWFAVTALFRHPLGLPIPHTAVIRERKDQFGATLGAFVQENFLGADIVGERVRAAGVAGRLSAWLVQPANADVVARVVLDAAVGVVDVLQDDDVQRVLHEEIERALGAVDLAPLAGRALTVATSEGRHRELLDVALKGVITFLDEQREPLRARFGQESPWWLPHAVEDKLFDRIVDGARLLLASVVADPNHEMRGLIDDRLAALADRLQHDPLLKQRGDELKRDLLGHAELRRWTSSLWTDAKVALRTQAPDPTSALRTRLAGAVVAAGERLRAEPGLRRTVDVWSERAARHVVEHYRDEIGGLITATVARWDAAETSDKLELLLGRDLQFIRINGTVVGGLAGLALHVGSDTLGRVG